MSKYGIYGNWKIVDWPTPLSDSPGEPFLESLKIEGKLLSIAFNTSDSKIVTFNFPRSSQVRIIDESFRNGLWIRRSDGEVKLDHHTYCIENSEFIELLDSDGAWKHFNPEGKHYFFTTPDECIDVLSKFHPEIIVTDHRVKPVPHARR